MSNIQQVMKEEIRRLARKEIKLEVAVFLEQIAKLKKLVSEQNTRIKLLEEHSSAPEATGKSVLSRKEISEAAKKIRFTKGGIIELRSKLGVTQVEFAALLGVNSFTVCNWERGKSTPRAAHKLQLAGLRKMGQRDLKEWKEALAAK